jgi:hypothetical protein
MVPTMHLLRPAFLPLAIGLDSACGSGATGGSASGFCVQYDDGGYCSCGSYPPDADQHEVDSCASGGSVSCCQANDDSSCLCSPNACTSGDVHEVDACAIGAIETCTDVPLTSCSETTFR